MADSQPDGSLPPQAARAVRQKRTPKRQFPEWAPVAGFVLLLVTIAFLMFLVVRPTPIECDRRGILVFIMALTSAGATGFLSGSASVRGTIPFFKNSPAKIAATGAIATLLLVMAAGFRFYASEAHCSPNQSTTNHDSPITMPPAQVAPAPTPTAAPITKEVPMHEEKSICRHIFMMSVPYAFDSDRPDEVEVEISCALPKATASWKSRFEWVNANLSKEFLLDGCGTGRQRMTVRGTMDKFVPGHLGTIRSVTSEVDITDATYYAFHQLNKEQLESGGVPIAVQFQGTDSRFSLTPMDEKAARAWILQESISLSNCQ